MTGFSGIGDPDTGELFAEYCVMASTDDGITWHSLCVAGVTWMGEEQAQDVYFARSAMARRDGLDIRFAMAMRLVSAPMMWPHEGPGPSSDARARSDVEKEE